MYMCGKPGTGKTATLRFVLQELSAKEGVNVHFFNAMTYEDTKTFLIDLDRYLCGITGRKCEKTKLIPSLVSCIRDSIRKLNCYKYIPLSLIV